MSVTDRMGRLLFIVPYVADRDGVPLKELAELLDVKPAQILADLDLLAMVGRPPLTPDHLIDLYVEDDIVYVDLDQSLTRPLQLTHEEARALVLGAKIAGDLGGLGKQLESVLERIVEKLNPHDQEMLRSLQKRIGVWRDDTAAMGPGEQLQLAIDRRFEVDIDYYSASSDRQKRYRLRPIALIGHSGSEYLVALDVGAELHEKLFRLDRMADCRVSDDAFEPPSDVDLEKFRKPTLYFGNDGLTAEVHFSAKVAQVVRERFADRDVIDETDGSVRVRLSTSSAAWLARWVLPFAEDAEILAPVQSRRAIGRLCREAAEAYAKA